MTVSYVIEELGKIERLFGDLPLRIVVERTYDRKEAGLLGKHFVRCFSDPLPGAGRVCFLHVETPRAKQW